MDRTYYAHPTNSTKLVPPCQVRAQLPTTSVAREEVPTDLSEVPRDFGDWSGGDFGSRRVTDGYFVVVSA